MDRERFHIERSIEMYKNISPNLNFVEEEKKIKQFWDDNKIFEKSIKNNKKSKI